MTVQVIRAAKADIAASHQFYEKQQQGMGKYFVECILGDIAELEKTGEAFTVKSEAITT